MKTLYKAVIVSVLGLGTIATAQAQATYNSDLIIGFTTTTGNDVEFDAGTVGSLYSGEQFDLGSLVNLSTLSTVDWGVIASVSSSHTEYLTELNTPGFKVNGLGGWGALNTPVKSIYTQFATAGAGNSATPAASNADSWNVETVNPTLSTDYLNATGHNSPNAVGETSVNFYSLTDDNTAASLFGSFTLDDTGTVTFTAVPEPSAYGIMAGAGLLVVSLRNRFSNKKA